MLKTNRLNLRQFKPEDISLLYQLHSNPEVAKTTVDGIQSLEKIQEQLNAFISHQQELGYSQMAVFENSSGKFVGRAGITFRSLSEETGKKPEVRFAFLPEFWGQGYASEITRELIRFSFEDLKLETIAAAHGETNGKSEHILLKHGFKFVQNIIPQGFAMNDITKFYLLNFDR
ncbi:MAG: GNAT family N-acetyltransferase [Pseudomonadota bacterium]